jgi:uncharacterized repeat protein (TIGR01451 family)
MNKKSKLNQFFNKVIITGFIGLVLAGTHAWADISGTVFRDYNGNGSHDVGEPYISHLTVSAYDTSSTSTPCGTATTNGFSSPNYTITGCSGDVRVEFDIPSNGCSVDNQSDFSTFNGSNSASSVQFVTATSTDVDFGIFDPDNFNTLSNPDVLLPVYINGSGVAGSTSGNSYALISFPYQNAGSNPDSDFSTNPVPQSQAPTVLATQSSIGSVWGTAYSKQANRIFTSAFMKRHVGIGPAGSGGIYMIDPASPPASGDIPSNMSLDTLGITTSGNGVYTSTPIGFHDVIGTNIERGLQNDFSQPSHDASAYGQAGKVSLGDLEISSDGQYLYTINLYDRKLYQIDLNDPENPGFPATNSGIKSYDAVPWLNYSCDEGVARPFGLKYYREKLYVGVICTAENKTLPSPAPREYPDGLRALVYEINPVGNGNGSLVMEFPLNYNKDNVAGGDSAQVDGWFSWSDDYNDTITRLYHGTTTITQYVSHPQPILADIEFDSDGSIILSFMDRGGHQWGTQNYEPVGTTTRSYVVGGDLLRTYRNPANGCAFELEADGVAGPYTSNAAMPAMDGSVQINTGPGSPNGTGATFTAFQGDGKEFFFGDYANVFNQPYPQPHHNEVNMGGIALFGESGEVMNAQIDAVHGSLFAAGVVKHNLQNGDRDTNIGGYNVYTYTPRLTDDGFFAKSGGLGDVEIMVDNPELEIGNRVWNDLDGNGIQDAGEPAISGVVVTLTCGGLTATSTSNANGEWLIKDGDLTGGANIPRNTSCTINVPLAEPASGNGLTSQVAGTRTGSDPDPVTGSFTFTTGSDGQNNHDYDIGYSAVPPSPSSTGCTTITNTATIVSLAETDTNSTNNTSSFSLQANCDTPVPDLRLVKRADKTEVIAGESLTFTLELTNEGTGDATDIQVEDNLPVGLTYVSDNPQQGNYDAGTGIWDVGNLLAGQTVTLEITVSVD